MKGLLLFVTFLTALSTLECDDGEIYTTITKQSQSYATEESYQILKDNLILKTSTQFADSTTRTDEYCLAPSSYSMYTFKMMDSGRDGWEDNTFVEIKTKYGNVIFKSMMEDYELATYTISYYTPIEKASTWKVKSNVVDAAWNQVSFDVTSWTDVDVSAPVATFSGTQYFRQLFTGKSGLAAYELQIYYRYGVIAYINGKEVYRDNIMAGAVVATTPASGCYATIGYHGVIRSALETSATESVLAIELHFMGNGNQTTVDLNAWIGIYASTVLDSTAPNCYSLPSYSTIIGSEPSDAVNSMDYAKSSNWMTWFSDGAAWLKVGYSSIKPAINAISIFSSRMPNMSPTSYTVSGSETVSSTADKATFLIATNVVNKRNSYSFRYGVFNAVTYPYYQIDFLASSTTRVVIYEMSLYVCSLEAPTSLIFTQTAYTGKVDVDAIKIKPTADGFMSCTLDHVLPAGLIFSNNTCTVSGIATVAMTTTTFVMTSTMVGFTPMSGSFSLTITVCDGNIMELKRTYGGGNVNMEAFKVTDADSNIVVYDEPENSVQVSSFTSITRMCVSGSRFKVTLYGTSTMWAMNSFLYLSAVSGGIVETIGRVNYCEPLHMRTEYFFGIGFSVASGSEWHYKMGSIPSNWYDTSMTGWETAAVGSFPNSSNRFQLYKKSFTIASMASVGGFSMTLKYRYAVVIYLNGVEAFLNGVVGTLSETTTTEHVYSDTSYHTVSLPSRSMAEDSLNSKQFIKQGENTIAVALIAIANTLTESNFDLTLRLFRDDETSRLFNYEYEVEGMISFSNPFDNDMMGSMYADEYVPNHIDVWFDNDRRETLTSFSVTNYYYSLAGSPDGTEVFGKNEEDTTWTPIGTFVGWKWWSVGQQKKIYMLNNKAYHRYRFANWKSTMDPNDSYWKVNRLDLYVDNLNRDVPDLAYESLDAYLNVEIAEIFPNSDLFSQFTVNRNFPTGLYMDQSTGAIMGTATVEVPSTEYIITARKLTGVMSSAKLVLAVTVCYGGKSLITSTFRTSDHSNLQFYKVHAGRGLLGAVVREENHFFISGNDMYADFCLPHGIYTIETGIDGIGDGVNFPGGYMLTVDIGSLRFEMNMIPDDAESPLRSVVSTIFSSYLPFQIKFDEWYAYLDTDAVPSDWNLPSFDASVWQKVKNLNATSAAVTTYTRRTFAIPSLEDYTVLNVHVKYGGGLAAYFNGRLVARFNLPDTFNANTEATAIHDVTVFSRFHVILETAGATTDGNVMAFELHRPVLQSSAVPVQFDATGVFGVESCSIVRDSFSSVSGTTPSYGTLESILDLSPASYATLEGDKGTVVEWTVENMEGSRFNSYGFYNGVSDLTLGFSLYARHSTQDDFTTLHETPHTVIVDRRRVTYSTPVGVASFKSFKWEIDVLPSASPQISDIVFQYCKASGVVCPGVDDYPSVPEGQISPSSSCPAKYTGYSYRDCKNGILSEPKNEFCVPKIPANVAYKLSRYTFVLNTHVTTGIPTYDNIVESYSLETQVLPAGLLLDALTGAISGIPSNLTELTVFTVYAKNVRGAAVAVVSISVRMGECPVDGLFEKTLVGQTYVYECGRSGNYIGTQKRTCVLGMVDGEWQKATGYCMAVVVLVVVIVVAIVVIVIVVIIIIRVSKRKRAVGGVKGKKTVISAAVKKEKTVKV